MSITLRPPRVSSVLPDLSKPLGADSQVIQAAGGSFRIDRVLLEGGRRTNVELLVVDTGNVRAAIIPTRGLGLWRANIDGVECGWKSPVDGPIHPQWVAIPESSGLGWLDGFDELMVRCGLRSFGAPDFDPKTNRLAFPLHGRIANLPTSKLTVEVDAAHSLLHVSGTVCESRFLQYNVRLTAKYTFALGSSVISMHDTVTNDSDTPTTVQMLYHVNIGRPLLGKGSKIYLGASRIVARDAHAADDVKSWAEYPDAEAGYVEQVYFSASAAKADHWASSLLTSPAGDKGFAVHYDTRTLPFFTQWKNTVGDKDGYVTGLEPGTGFPNPRSFEEKQGRVVTLDAGKSVEFQVKLEALSTQAKVSALAAALQAQQGAAVETVGFDENWCTPRG